MARKLPVLLAFGAAGRTPTVEAIRTRLGGRASTEHGAGELVSLTSSGGFEHAGIVIFTHGQDVDVWTGEGVVRRARWNMVRHVSGPAPDDLARVATDAATFGGLVEGQRVRYRHDSGVDEGTLVEKCKFGGLIEKDDRTIVGVSFRRLWPAETN
jgi:hypothetical protein